MRVCHFCASTGMGRGDVYVDLVNRMATHASDVTPALLVPADARGLERIDTGVEVLTYRTGFGRLNPFLWREVADRIRALKPDLVHTHFAKATAIYCRIAGRLNIPWVATKHNPRRGAAFNRAPRVIAVSAAVRDSIHHDRVRVIYNGLVPAEVEKPTPRREGPLQILNVGRLEPVKGQDRLIRVLAESGADWTLTILGDGPFRGELQRLAASLGVEHLVSLPGHQENVPKAMASCDVFVQASRSEGFGVALLEAMHYAPLAISTPVGLAAEFFPDWLIWNPGDAASLLTPLFSEYDARRERFESWAADLRPRFHLDHAVREHVICYREILDTAEASNSR